VYTAMLILSVFCVWMYTSALRAKKAYKYHRTPPVDEKEALKAAKSFVCFGALYTLSLFAVVILGLIKATILINS
jgi:hypothetical protein